MALTAAEKTALLATNLTPAEEAERRARAVRARLSTSIEIVCAYAPLAPSDVQHAAIELMNIWINEQKKAGQLKRIEFSDQEIELTGSRHMMLTRSGAAGLLSSWRSPPVLSLSDE